MILQPPLYMHRLGQMVLLKACFLIMPWNPDQLGLGWARYLRTLGLLKIAKTMSSTKTMREDGIVHAEFSHSKSIFLHQRYLFLGQRYLFLGQKHLEGIEAFWFPSNLHLESSPEPLTSTIKHRHIRATRSPFKPNQGLAFPNLFFPIFCLFYFNNVVEPQKKIGYFVVIRTKTDKSVQIVNADLDSRFCRICIPKRKKRTTLDAVINKLVGGNKKKKLIIKSYIKNY